MNYEANEVDWNVGDIVIHDCDAKKEHMLMVVIKKEISFEETVYLTRYVYAGTSTNQRKVWKNCKEVLHEPKRFNIKVSNILRDSTKSGNKEE